MGRLVLALFRRVYLVPSLLVFGVVLAWTWNMFEWRYGVWTSTSYMAYATLLVAGPVLAGGGAWAGVRLGNRRTAFALASQVRADRGSPLHHLAVGVGSLVGAYVLALLPVFIFTALTATHDGPGLLQLLNGLVSAATFVCVGYAAGRLLPWPATPPIVAVAVYGISGLLLIDGGRWNALTPARDALPTIPWIVENPAVLAYQAALYALLALAAGWAVVVYLSIHQRQDRWRRPAAVAIIAMPILVPVLVAWHPPLQLILTEDELPPPVCAPSEGHEVCVHPALAKDLPDVTPVIDELVELYGGRLPTGATRFYAGIAIENWDPLGFHVYPITSIRDDIGLYLPGGLAGTHACVRPDEDEVPVPPQELRITDAVRAWLTDKLAVDPALGLAGAMEGGEEYLARLMSLPDDRVSTWISEHRDRLFACEVTADMLP